MAKANTLTIAVCTYNRSTSLSRLLNLLQSDLLIPQNWDVSVLVVDNNSTDNTRQVVESSAGQLDVGYAFAAKQGLAAARNKAIEIIDSDWILFVDDDVQLVSDWLTQYCQVIDQYSVDFLGGRILLHWDKPKPGWLIDEDLALLAGVLGKYDLGDQTLDYTELEVLPCGANFAISRALIERVGDFNEGLGVIGNVPGRGEETEFFSRAVERGARGYYCGKAVCFHDALVERLTVAYMLKHGYQKGVAEHVVGNRHSGSRYLEWLFWVKALVQLLKGRRDRSLQCIINVGMQRGLREHHRGLPNGGH